MPSSGSCTGAGHWGTAQRCRGDSGARALGAPVNSSGAVSCSFVSSLSFMTIWAREPAPLPPIGPAAPGAWCDVHDWPETLADVVFGVVIGAVLPSYQYRHSSGLNIVVRYSLNHGTSTSIRRTLLSRPMHRLLAPSPVRSHPHRPRLSFPSQRAEA